MINEGTSIDTLDKIWSTIDLIRIVFDLSIISALQIPWPINRLTFPKELNLFEIS